ncbi:phosphatidylcholine:diacylglycerol cholinephosphotransferase 1-like [Cucurbita pepo subsp. pepo]|uniref:phosphatidylcholine:diacylglycerol cholinephosphotransferase 1-like n=1 Tax=Cucurbita pepo subsp. pepo TaxID=3664 RepID=UPI000C9D801E|nr:phosphatidylcholine:diacylglycerol cholinephosphotransferase 1-like [Cucurbita pepo subsp. pepo]
MASNGAATTLTGNLRHRIDSRNGNGIGNGNGNEGGKMTNKDFHSGDGGGYYYKGFRKASCMRWTVEDVAHVARYHWIPCVFAMGLLFFMGVEYTLRMVPPASPPFDLGFALTRPVHRVLSSWPELNTLLAALNTVFVGMQTTYILWSWLIEGRPRATISALFMFTCRGILGYSTQLPLPQGFLGSEMDFPVGNVSFFLFFSGHVAGSVIASLDMRRMRRWGMAWMFDFLNLLQAIRLLGTRGHYTIDLAVGVGAGILFDSLAGHYYEASQRKNIEETKLDKTFA